MTEFYPLLFEPILSERPWGGRGLQTMLGKTLPPGEKIGESWEIYSASVIANGALAGRTLRAVLDEYGEALGPRHDDDFPLLVKFLDAQEWLSVQVHPDDALAKQLEGQPRGKTECWYIVHAEPGATLALGTSHAMTPDDYRAAVAAGKARETMAYQPVVNGDFIYVPARTPHAVGPGILFYELQQSSDTTYRVYDWDRLGKDGKPRELHLDKALAVMDLAPRPDAVQHPKGRPDANGNWVSRLISGPYFALEHVRLATPETVQRLGGTCHLLSVIEGTISIAGVTLIKGQSTLIPAAMDQYTIRQSGGAQMLKAWPVS